MADVEPDDTHAVNVEALPETTATGPAAKETTIGLAFTVTVAVLE